MKKTAITLALVAAFGLSACSSNKPLAQGGTVNPGAQTAISEQRLANDFKRQGVRVIYTLLGDIEAIEVTGYAPVWGSSQNAAREAFRVAELEAKKAMNDFINKEIIQSSVSVAMISRNLERARDNKTNKFETNLNRDQVVSSTDDEQVDANEKGEVNRQTNTASRNDAVNIASRVNTNITIRSQGILGGMYLVEGDVISDGKAVRVVYRWDQKHNKVRGQVRNLMAQ